MEVLYFLSDHWFAAALLVIGLVLGVAVLFISRQRASWFGLVLLASTLCLMGLGGVSVTLAGLKPHMWVPLAVFAIALALLFAKLVIVVASGQWWAPMGYTLGAVLAFSFGAVCADVVGDALADAGRTLTSLEIVQPWWLLLLVLIPVIILLSFRSLAGLGPMRRWLAIGLCCAMVLFLTLALGELRMRSPNENVTVLFVLDQSFSIPQQYDVDAPADASGVRKDLRGERIRRFINGSVEARAPHASHKRDMAGLIVFGKRPRLELPPSNAPRFNFVDVASNIDPYYTDIGAAIKLALASFPEGTGKRIVLISDGNQNLGNAEEQAQLAVKNKVQIDVIPLAAGFKNENEVLVEKVEAPPLTEQGSRLPVRVQIRSYNPQPVVGVLELRKIVDGQISQVEGSPMLVRLRPGLNPFTFKQALSKEQKSYTYEAKFQPKGVEQGQENIIADVTGDRPQNNRATTHVVALGKRRVLVIEAKEGEQANLVDHLRRLGESKFQVYPISAAKLPQGEGEMGVFLSNYDCVILANVPAELLNEEQQKMIQSNTHDQGCGLIMVGGPDSFGAGGWQGTPVEKALPVDCDIKSLKVEGKGGLVLIMHACEMADGNKWTKEIAKLAIRKLSPMDEVGIIYWGWGQTMWHIKLQQIGDKRNSMLNQVDKMSTGDMMDYDPALQMALDALTEPGKDLATKHIILISDGDAQQMNKKILADMKANKVTCTTVGVATHGVSEDTNLTNIANATGGRFHKVTNPRALPSIYIKEARLVSQSFIHEKKFQPKLLVKSGPTQGLPDQLPPLYGFVRTTKKQSALAEMPIEGPRTGDLQFPILANWRYGLGKAVAFTSDARTLGDGQRLGWDRDWASSDIYLKFWEQVVDWSLREVETGRLTMTTEFRDGKVKVIVDARDENNRPIIDLNMRGGVTAPSAINAEDSKIELKFEQKNSGLYEAEFKAEDAGSYFINAQARRTIKEMKDGKEVTREENDSIRSGVTIPYSPEFADMESNIPMLVKLAEITGGKVYEDNDEALAAAAANLEAFRGGLPRSRSQQPIWFYLILLSGICLLANVAVRRIAIDPSELFLAARNYWDRLRGRTLVVEKTPEFMDRLRSRKAAVGESLTKGKAARRFDMGEDAPALAPPPSADEAALPGTGTGTGARRSSSPPPRVAPEKEEDAADYASRLMRAKKRVWQNENRDKPT